MKSLLIAILLLPLILNAQGIRPTFLGAAEQQKAVVYTPTYVAQADYHNDGTTTNALVLNITNSAQGFTVLAAMSRNSKPVTNVSDTLGSTWTLSKALTNASNRYLFVYYGTNLSAGSNLITVKLSDVVTFVSARAYHFTGVQLGSPKDQETSASGTGGAAPYTVVCGPITPTSDGQLVFGSAMADAGGQEPDITGGWNQAASPGVSYPEMHYKIQATAAAITSYMTNDTSSDLYDSYVVSFKHQ